MVRPCPTARDLLWKSTFAVCKPEALSELPGAFPLMFAGHRWHLSFRPEVVDLWMMPEV